MAGVTDLTAAAKLLAEKTHEAMRSKEAQLAELRGLQDDITSTQALITDLPQKGYFAERSAMETVGILERRKDLLGESMAAVAKEVEELRAHFAAAASRAVEEAAEGQIDITEKYDEAMHGPAGAAGREPKQAPAAAHRDQAEDEEEERLFARLAELEEAEARGDEPPVEEGQAGPSLEEAGPAAERETLPPGSSRTPQKPSAPQASGLKKGFLTAGPRRRPEPAEAPQSTARQVSSGQQLGTQQPRTRGVRPEQLRSLGGSQGPASQPLPPKQAPMGPPAATAPKQAGPTPAIPGREAAFSGVVVERGGGGGADEFDKGGTSSVAAAGSGRVRQDSGGSGSSRPPGRGVIASGAGGSKEERPAALSDQNVEEVQAQQQPAKRVSKFKQLRGGG